MVKITIKNDCLIRVFDYYIIVSSFLVGKEFLSPTLNTYYKSSSVAFLCNYFFEYLSINIPKQGAFRNT